jgi:Leucine-rich repeat (LRR) protein
MKKKILLNEGQYHLLFENDNQKFIDEVKNLISSGQIENIETALQMGKWMKAEGIFDVKKYLAEEYKGLVKFLKSVNYQVKNGNYIENIVYMLNLTRVDLGVAALGILPKEIGQLKNLTTLIATNNHLKDLPKEIGNLTNLEWLALADNHLTSLPSEIGRLQNLRILSLPNNRLTSLPSEIGRLQNLTTLNLSNNPLPLQEKANIEKMLPNCDIEF